MTERKNIPAKEVLGAAREENAPDFWDKVTITGTEPVGEEGKRFVGLIETNGEKKWKSVVASSDELERYRKAKRKQ